MEEQRITNNNLLESLTTRHIYPQLEIKYTAYRLLFLEPLLKGTKRKVILVNFGEAFCKRKVYLADIHIE